MANILGEPRSPATPLPPTVRSGTRSVRTTALLALLATAAGMIWVYRGPQRGMDALFLPLSLGVLLPVIAVLHLPAMQLAALAIGSPGPGWLRFTLAPLVLLAVVSLGLVLDDWERLWFLPLTPLPTFVVLLRARQRHLWMAGNAAAPPGDAVAHVAARPGASAAPERTPAQVDGPRHDDQQ